MKTTLLMAALSGLAFVSSAVAEDSKDIYFSGSAGPTVFAVQFDNSTVEDIVANTHWGIGGNAMVCKNTSSYFDICGGVTGFISTGGAEQLVSAANGGGTTETEVQSFGGIVQARGKMGRLHFSPFAGVRKIKAQKSAATGNALIPASKIDTTAYFGGLELATSVFNDRGQIGISGEYGRSDGDLPTEQFNYGSASAFLRINF